MVVSMGRAEHPLRLGLEPMLLSRGLLRVAQGDTESPLETGYPSCWGEVAVSVVEAIDRDGCLDNVRRRGL